jgi:hypothetical protein
VTVDRIPGVLYWGKLPVPFVAAWSSEDAIRVVPDPVVSGQPALFRGGTRGLGTPMFGKMDESRVRRVVLRRLCQICAGSIGPTGYVVDSIKGTVGGDPLLSEPLSCLRCFRIALALCPGIARMRGGARAIVVRCTKYQAVTATVRVYEGEGCDPVLNAALRAWKGAPPIGYAKYAPSEYDVLPMAWLDSAEARGAA